MTWPNIDYFLIFKNGFFWKMKSWIFKFCSNNKSSPPDIFEKKSPSAWFFVSKSLLPLFFPKKSLRPLSMVPAWVPDEFWPVPYYLIFKNGFFLKNMHFEIPKYWWKNLLIPYFSGKSSPPLYSRKYLHPLIFLENCGHTWVGNIDRGKTFSEKKRRAHFFKNKFRPIFPKPGLGTR